MNGTKGNSATRIRSPLHQATYESLKRRQSSTYEFDPRPVHLRKAEQDRLNTFVKDQQVYAAKYNETPMRLSLFKIKSGDFEIDDFDGDYYNRLTFLFAQNLFERLHE